ncbi:MAG: hypothetical protein NVS1B13_00460 [Flavisolibacter sp.]
MVLAEITAGDTANIPIGMTLIAGSGAAISFLKINTASAFVSASNGSVFNLVLNTSPDFLNNQMSVYSNPIIFKENETYRLSVKQNGLANISASTQIPSNFIADTVSTDNSSINGKDVMVFNFSVKDTSNTKRFYIFEALKQKVKLFRYFFWQGIQYDYDTPSGQILYNQVKGMPGVNLSRDTIPTNQYIRLNVYTQDPNTENSSFGNLDSAFRRIFITDSVFIAGYYASKFAISKDYFVASSPSERGRILVRIKSVSKELFLYLSQYEKYKSDFILLPVSQVNSPIGNIINGIGVFGGVYKKEWTYYYDVLE